MSWESSGSTSTWQNQVASSYYHGPSVSYFENAENTNITNSHIITNVTQVQARSTGLDVLGNNSALGAIYNSLERQQLDAPKCHPDTRKAVIKKLVDWICGRIASEALIMWLYGAAGAGKSAIAHTLTEICENCGWLVASFFFWKTAGERNNANYFVATIAHQIALAIPSARELIGAAVDYNPFIFQQSFDTQLAKLVIEPLEQLYSDGLIFDISPLVVIIDGLDECQGADIQSGLVRSLAAAFHNSALRIRIFIASRPEVHLQSTFNSASVQPRLLRLPLSDEYSPDKDIYRFLADSFKKIRSEHPLKSYIPSSWPSSSILHELTKKSSGQFIFASTTVKYVGGDLHQLPHRRLDVIRRLQPPRGEEDLPYAELNSLYNHVLSNVRGIERVKQVLGVLLIVNPILKDKKSRMTTAGDMDDFLLWQSGETEACLSQLASIIECNPVGHLRILHASLVDFLLDPTRSHQFYLCRQSILGDSVAQGLRHIDKYVIGEKKFSDCHPYAIMIHNCLNADLLCTTALQQELCKLSFKKLYDVYASDRSWYTFWWLSSPILEMLHNQNLENHHSHLISDLTIICLQSFNGDKLVNDLTKIDDTLPVLVYEAQYSHLLQVEASNLASEYPFQIQSWIKTQSRQHIKRIVTMHPQRKSLELTGQQYAIIARHLMELLSYGNFCSSADVFNSSDGNRKQWHSNSLYALLWITHVLPLACESKKVLNHISPGSRGSRRYFHEGWRLDGWNDHIIQPARDAVLEYYKRCAKPSAVEKYMRLHNLP